MDCTSSTCSTFIGPVTIYSWVYPGAPVFDMRVVDDVPHVVYDKAGTLDGLGLGLIIRSAPLACHLRQKIRRDVLFGPSVLR